MNSPRILKKTPTWICLFIRLEQNTENQLPHWKDLEESATLVARASMNAMKQKPDEWLQKKMQNHDLNYLMQDAYRERNIDLLDSIDKAMYTDYYRENMLYIRNENMTRSLDSVVRLGKVFAGIGAAHLPGEHGVIQLLKDKGYTVKPMVSKASAKGQQLKRKLENKVRQTPLERHEPEDGSFSLLLPNKLYPLNENKTTVYVSPDLANGSYLMVNRIPTYSFLRNEGVYTVEEIESLLFENIPGEILIKSFVNKGDIKGIEVINVLKNGDYQRYQIYLKPLEIIIFKMAGEGEYVKKNSDKIFNSLTFKSNSQKSVQLESDYADFSVQMPGEYSFCNPSRNGTRMIEAIDPASGSYYFLRRASLIDFKSLEEDEFELKQIQKRFYQDLGLDANYGQIDEKQLRSQAVFDHEEGRVLHLMTTLKRSDYYLLGIITDDPKKAHAYFNSFELKEESYPEAFKKN